MTIILDLDGMTWVLVFKRISLQSESNRGEKGFDRYWWVGGELDVEVNAETNYAVSQGNGGIRATLKKILASQGVSETAPSYRQLGFDKIAPSYLQLRSRSSFKGSRVNQLWSRRSLRSVSMGKKRFISRVAKRSTSHDGEYSQKGSAS